MEIDCLDGSAAAVAAVIGSLPGIRRIDETEVGLTVHVEHGTSPQAVANAALESDGVASVRVRAPDMVEVFQSLTEDRDG